jgi:Circadian oscillating protein COP23
MRNSSVVFLSLTLALLVGTNAAWSESRIERDNRTANSTSPQSTSTSSQSSQSSSSSGRGSTATASSSTSSPNVANGTSRFACETANGQQTVVYRPQSRPGEAYPWAIPSDMGSSWNSPRRCGEISRRLETYRPDGLQELRIGVENRYNIVCVTTEKNPACRIVFTVPSNQDPVAVRDRVFRNLTLADSGQRTEGVNTFAGGNDNPLDSLFGKRPSQQARNVSRKSPGQGINLKPFLSQEDGGTANQIGNPVAVPSQYRLDPGKFR